MWLRPEPEFTLHPLEELPHLGAWLKIMHRSRPSWCMRHSVMELDPSCDGCTLIYLRPKGMRISQGKGIDNICMLVRFFPQSRIGMAFQFLRKDLPPSSEEASLACTCAESESQSWKIS